MRNKFNTESYSEYVTNVTNSEYRLIGIYEKSSKHVTLFHSVCGITYSVTPNHFNRGKRCPTCWKDKLSNSARHAHGVWSTERLRLEVFKRVQSEYTVVGKYIDSYTSLLFRHNSNRCEYHEYLSKSTNFLAGGRCPKCSRKDTIVRLNSYKPKKKQSEFISDVEKLFGEEYTVIGEYINNKTQIDMKHNICGNTYQVRPNDFLQREGRCPKCFRKMPRVSKPVTTILAVLNEANIEYATEVSFDKCRNKRPLKFDICIYLNISKTKYLLVEYNGEQHYRNTLSTDANGSSDRLEKQILRDSIKQEFCDTNDIPLKIIRFDEDLFDAINDILEYCINA